MQQEFHAEPYSIIEKEIGLGITFQSKLSDRRVITFSAPIARDAPLAEFHELIEKMSAVCDRQEMKFLLEDLERNLIVDRDGLKAAEEAFLTIDAKNEADWARRGKKGTPKLSDSETAAKMQCGVNIQRFRAEIKKKEIAIDELREKITRDV